MSLFRSHLASKVPRGSEARKKRFTADGLGLKGLAEGLRVEGLSFKV